MAAVTSASDLAAPSKRSRGLADIDPKFVSNVIITKSLSLSPFLSLLYLTPSLLSMLLFLFLGVCESCHGNRLVVTFNECGHPISLPDIVNERGNSNQSGYHFLFFPFSLLLAEKKKLRRIEHPVT